MLEMTAMPSNSRNMKQMQQAKNIFLDMEKVVKFESK